ncbi:MAG: DUF3096 domain-containing protein [Thermoplasmata archaeon]|nr:DUF3096 domain-containing protein [Euryarchaeota archaeon]RLF66685.1 MAG: DUF3096 domain-containing protein [Thermoplasmata archaeon]
MPEKKIDEKIVKVTRGILKDFLGIDLPDIVLATIMIIFGVLFIAFPQLVGILLGILFIIIGILILLK